MRSLTESFRLLFVLLVSLAVCLFSRPAEAKYGGGTGEPNDPYLICTAEQMNAIGADPNDWDKHFVLANDVNLAGYTGTQFNIIGPNNNKSFTGVFDGQGHKILNFTWHGTDRDAVCVGLFGHIDGGEVKNLGLENVDINAPDCDCVGGLVGSNGEGIISNCYATGNVIGHWIVGGLVGFNAPFSSISNCYATGNVSGGGSIIGGLVGANIDSGISDCSATGSVSGEGDGIGGLVGDNRNSTISGCSATGSVTGGSYVGGLVGGNDEGGFISNCYATGSVSGEAGFVGGLVGSNSDGTISSCYAIGDVSGQEDYVGGLVAWNGDTVSTSFWDIETSDCNTSAGGTGKTTAEMQMESTFTDAGWDFVGETINGTEDIWTICERTNYPRFVWQIPEGDFLCPDGIDMLDFAVLALAWLSEVGDANWNPACNISETNDNVIDESDLGVFTDNWLAGK